MYSLKLTQRMCFTDDFFPSRQILQLAYPRFKFRLDHLFFSSSKFPISYIINRLLLQNRICKFVPRHSILFNSLSHIITIYLTFVTANWEISIQTLPIWDTLESRSVQSLLAPLGDLQQLMLVSDVRNAEFKNLMTVRLSFCYLYGT